VVFGVEDITDREFVILRGIHDGRWEIVVSRKSVLMMRDDESGEYLFYGEHWLSRCHSDRSVKGS